MTAIDWNPDRSKLRQFGWLSLGGFTLLGLALGMSFGHLDNQAYFVPAIPWTLGIAAALLAVVRVEWLRPMYLTIISIMAIAGSILGTILLGLAFFLLFNPLSLICKWIGQEDLHMRIDRAALTCWATKATKRPASFYLRQHRVS